MVGDDWARQQDCCLTLESLLILEAFRIQVSGAMAVIDVRIASGQAVFMCHK